MVTVADFHNIKGVARPGAWQCGLLDGKDNRLHVVAVKHVVIDYRALVYESGRKLKYEFSPATDCAIHNGGHTMLGNRPVWRKLTCKV